MAIIIYYRRLMIIKLEQLQYYTNNIRMDDERVKIRILL